MSRALAGVSRAGRAAVAGPLGVLALLTIPGTAIGIAGAATDQLPVELVGELNLSHWLNGIVQWTANAGTWLATAGDRPRRAWIPRLP